MCGPDWMTAAMTQSIPVLFFQGRSTPTPPVDRSEGDAEWARSKDAYLFKRRVERSPSLRRGETARVVVFLASLR